MQVGVQVVRRALEEPPHRNARKVGRKGEEVVTDLSRQPGNGIDLQTGAYVNMFVHERKQSSAFCSTSLQAQAKCLPQMLDGCRLESFWIGLTVSFHEASRSWQKQSSIGYAPLNNGRHGWSQGRHLRQKGSLLVVEMSSNMPFAAGHAINPVLQQKQADERAMEGKLPLHAYGDVLTLHHDWKHAEKANKLFY